MTITTLFPDGDTETNTVDGYAGRESVEQTWADIRAAAGNASNDSAATIFFIISTHVTTQDRWDFIRRNFFLFDSSVIGSNETITAATMEIVVISKTDDFSDSVSLVKSTPASNTAVVDADYQQTGSVKQASDVTVASLTADSSTYNALTLNAAGLVGVDKTGITKLGLRSKAEVDDAEPSWVANKETQLVIASAEEVLTDDKRPKLVVTHSTTPNFLLMSIGDLDRAQPLQIATGVRSY